MCLFVLFVFLFGCLSVVVAAAAAVDVFAVDVTVAVAFAVVVVAAAAAAAADHYAATPISVPYMQFICIKTVTKGTRLFSIPSFVLVLPWLTQCFKRGNTVVRGFTCSDIHTAD